MEEEQKPELNLLEKWLVLGSIVWVFVNLAFWPFAARGMTTAFLYPNNAVQYALGLTFALGLATVIATVAKRCSGGVALFAIALQLATFFGLIWIAQSIGHAA